MKLRLLTALLLFGFSASAQVSITEGPKLLKQSNVLGQLPNDMLQNDIFSQKINKDSLTEQFRGIVIGKKATSGIYYLPQDTMPCLVPDTKDLAAIPNAWLNVQVPFKSFMPNPGLQDKPLIDQQKTTTK